MMAEGGMLKRLGLLLICTVAAVSAHGEVFYLVASANVEGANQTVWRTDLQLKAQGTDDAVVTIELLATGADNSDPPSIQVNIDAGHSVRLGNLLETHFGFEGTAAIRLTVDHGEIAATSRTFNTAADGTYGQTVPAVTDDEALEYGLEGTLIQLARSNDPSTGFRTNLGLVNLSSESVRIEIDLFEANGTPAGSLDRTLKPFEHRQLNDVFRSTGAMDIDDGFAVVRTTTRGGRFLAYASVVDNGSGDAVLLLSHRSSPAELPEQQRLVVFETFTRTACPICTEAKAALLDVQAAFPGDRLLVVDQSVDAPLEGRLDRWLAAYHGTGDIYLPLVMVDSGNEISNGSVSFVSHYSQMIEDAMDRPTAARMAVVDDHRGDLHTFSIRLSNDSGETLSATNGARLTVLLFEEVADGGRLPFAAAAASTPITTLADGETRDFVLEAYAPDFDPDRTRWVVIADYRPEGSDGAYDTLHAVQGP
jgi:hypothetical protein